MHGRKGCRIVAVLATAVLLGGCTAQQVDFTQIQRPDRPSELDAFNVFEGSWTWEATMANATEADQKWTGTARWDWTLDGRFLHGFLSAECADASFEAAGAWGWDGRAKRYAWWMFNDWGYAQEGAATYNAANKHWIMPFTSTGLDGTPSSGKYELTEVDNDTIEWRLEEWDSLHMVKKLEMTGTYKRQDQG